MINIAARATDGVKVPDRKTARKDIISLFKKQVTNLKVHLNVRESLLLLSADI